MALQGGDMGGGAMTWNVNPGPVQIQPTQASGHQHETGIYIYYY
jgi:hypothetical protein